VVRIAILKDGEELLQDTLFLPTIEITRPNPYPIDHKTHDKWKKKERRRLDLLALNMEVAEHNEAIDKAIRPTKPELPDTKCTPEEWDEYLKKVEVYKLKMRELGVRGFQQRGQPLKPEHLKKPTRPLTRNKHIRVLEEEGFIIDTEDMTISDGYGKKFHMLINGKIELINGKRMSSYAFIKLYTHGEL